MPEIDRKLSRRELLKFGKNTILAAAAVSTGLMTDSKDVKKSTPIIGATFRPQEARYWGLKPEELLEELLALDGIKVIRYPLYAHNVSPEKGVFDNFEEPQFFADRIAHSGKKIVWTVGLKSVGYPEVYPPRWLTREIPEIVSADFILDSHKEVAETTLELVEEEVKFINRYKQITEKIQVGNESNYPIPLALNRRFSNHFLQKEVGLVKSLTDLPIMLTYPDSPWTPKDWRSWLEGLFSCKVADFVGLNIYPQKTSRQQDPLVDWLYWTFLGNVAFPLIRAIGAKPSAAEFQTTHWRDSKTETRPYSIEKGQQDFSKLLSLNPTHVGLWDVEQARAYNPEENWEHIRTLAQFGE